MAMWMKHNGLKPFLFWVDVHVSGPLVCWTTSLRWEINRRAQASWCGRHIAKKIPKTGKKKGPQTKKFFVCGPFVSPVSGIFLQWGLLSPVSKMSCVFYGSHVEEASLNFFRYLWCHILLISSLHAVLNNGFCHSIFGHLLLAYCHACWCRQFWFIKVTCNIMLKLFDICSILSIIVPKFSLFIILSQSLVSSMLLHPFTECS